MAGRARPYPVLGINHLEHPEDTCQPHDEFQLPFVEAPETPEGGLIREIINMLAPLKLLNPVSPCFGLGVGPETLVSCFGIPLNPEAQHTPAYNKDLDQVLSEPFADPRISGLMPEMHKKIESIKENIPESLKIHFPDRQGPF